MHSYIGRRLLLLIPTLFLVTVVVFLLVRAIPGSIVDVMLMQQMSGGSTGGGGASQWTEEDRERIERKLGLDVPVLIQYVKWIGGILTRGDLGKSLWTERPVAKQVFDTTGVTFELGVLSFIISLVIAFPIGIISAKPRPR